jgi:hypothetical protein
VRIKLLVKPGSNSGDESAGITLPSSASYLDRLGKVVHCVTETEDSGWVIIEPYNRLNIYPEELLRPFGSATLEPRFILAPVIPSL